MSALDVIVTNVDQVADGIKHFTFEAADGGDLPAFSGGSHIVVSMPASNKTFRNAYSLLSNPDSCKNYQIAVRLQDPSRGGSQYMHDHVAVGSSLKISWPVNLFSLSNVAHRHLLIAGGIGITPFMSQVYDLLNRKVPFELHYAYRHPQSAAFVGHLKKLLGHRLICHDGSQGNLLDLMELFRNQPLGTHVYVCGPTPMVEGVIESAKHLGWPDQYVHYEEFLAPPTGEPFVIKLKHSDKTINVGPEESMLEAMEAAGVDAPYLCRGGACGRCELEVINTDGLIDHHDHYLSNEEKRSGKKIMPCVSRARCSFIELNF